MKALITGGSGFIGTNLVEYYHTKSVEVLNIDIAPPKNPAHNSLWRNINILDFEALQDEITKFLPTHIFNLAAQTGTNDKGRTIETYVTNTKGVMNVIKAAQNTSSVERVIFASSLAVCQSDYQPKNESDYCPETLYGQSKMLGEKIIRQQEQLPFSWAIVRPTGIWGPWFDVPYKSLFNTIKRGLYVHPGVADVVQSLGFVGNTVHQLDTLAQVPKEKVNGRTFYLADDEPINMQKWTRLIQKAFGAQRIKTIPIWALKPAALVGDGLKTAGWEVPPLSTTRLKNMLTSFVFDVDPLISKELPYKLEEAVQITVEWIHNKCNTPAKKA